MKMIRIRKMVIRLMKAGGRHPWAVKDQLVSILGCLGFQSLSQHSEQMGWGLDTFSGFSRETETIGCVHRENEMESKELDHVIMEAGGSKISLPGGGESPLLPTSPCFPPCAVTKPTS